MLHQIELTNFQRHESLTVAFGAGLNAIKAPNEGGKSTILRAISYALFGTSALPASLDEVVLWGHHVNTLKVVLDFSVAGVQYKITRSKGGAELTYDGGTVTGQTETTRYIAELLGADAKLAAQLLIANQNQIRGAIAGGSREATTLIERLADFQQIDELLDLLQTHLVTGSPLVLKGRLERAEQVLEEMDPAALEPIDEEALQAEMDRAQEELARSRSDTDQLWRAQQAAADARDQAMLQEANHAAAVVRVQERKQAREELAAQKPEPPGEVLDEKAARDALSQALQGVALVEAYQNMCDKNAELEAGWGTSRVPGPAEALKLSLEKDAERLGGLQQQRTKLSLEIARKEAMVLVGNCTACGKDMTDVPEVKARNEALQQEVEDTRARVAHLEVTAQELQEALDHDVAAWGEHGRLQQHASVKRDLARVVDDMIPGALEWIGPAVLDEAGAREKVDECERELNALLSANAQRAMRQRAMQDWERRMEAADSAVQIAQRQLEESGTDANVPALQAEALKARQAFEVSRDAHAALAQRNEALSRETHERIQRYRSAAAARAQAEREVSVCRTDLQQLEFNNALVKVVREARPAVTNRLWSLVLSAVSSYFSDMRGQPSSVTRAGGEFLVDGRPMSSLSGSTLDALGLAVRVALMRTFLPGLSLLILDEPNAAMDDERTSQVLGFISAAGFDQTIVVSHDELTVNVADHVITLE